MKNLKIIVFLLLLVFLAGTGGYFTAKYYNGHLEAQKNKISLEKRKAAWLELKKAITDEVSRFKGEGALTTEMYKGQGWGLLQVLERMKGTENGIQAVQEFVKAAGEILTERVNNSPPEKNEQRWLPGWKNRLNTYIQES